GRRRSHVLRRIRRHHALEIVEGLVRVLGRRGRVVAASDGGAAVGGSFRRPLLEGPVARPPPLLLPPPFLFVGRRPRGPCRGAGVAVAVAAPASAVPAATGFAGSGVAPRFARRSWARWPRMRPAPAAAPTSSTPKIRIERPLLRRLRRRPGGPSSSGTGSENS